MVRVARPVVVSLLVLLLFGLPSSAAVRGAFVSATPGRGAGRSLSATPSAADATPTPSASPSATNATPSPTGPTPSPSGSEPTPSPTPTEPEPSPTPSSSEPEPTPSETPTIHPGPPLPTLAVEAEASRLLLQVGDVSSYTATVTNTGVAPAEDVIATVDVPEQLEIAAVLYSSGVESATFGDGRGDDLIWRLGIVEPDEAVTLYWTAQAVAAGDYRAPVIVTATGEGAEAASAEERSYLATVRAVTLSDRSFKPLQRRVRLPASPQPEEAAERTGAHTLPATGYDPAAIVLIGALFVVTGLACVAISRRPAASSRALLLAVVFVLTACVSGDGPEDGADIGAPGTTSTPTASPSPSPDAGKTKTRVKGVRIRRAPDDAPPDRRADTDPLSQPLPPTPEAVPVPRFAIVTLGLDDLPVSELESHAGDNVVEYDWDEQNRGIGLASSSTTLVAGADARLLTAVSLTDGTIAVELTLTNLNEAERLAVNGRFVHEITGDDGFRTQLESEQVDVILAPGAVTSTTFSYLLPTGHYRAGARFEAS